jgi:homoserine dehydrogenase
MLYGRGAGALPTASAVVSDVIYAATHSEIKYSTFKNTATADSDTKFVADFVSAQYCRLVVEDKPGVLSKICGILGKYGISIVKVTQTEQEGGKATVIIVTDKTNENAMKNAVAKINDSGLGSVQAVIRVEE